METREQILNKFYLDEFTKTILLQTTDDIKFIEILFKHAHQKDFNDHNLQKFKYFMKYHSLDYLLQYIFEIDFWEEFDIEFQTKPNSLTEQHYLIGEYLLYGDTAFLSEHLFYMSYEYELFSNLMCEVKVAEYILDTCTHTIFYKDNTLKLHIFGY